MPALLPSEKPVRARVRHHWIVILLPPRTWIAITLLVLLVLAYVWPFPFAWVAGLVVLGGILFRWQAWRAEWIILTGRRLIRTEGVVETTTTESSMRLDRIAGARLILTVPGKVLGYGTIELEAPGDHQAIRRLVRIADAEAFYLTLRELIFDEPLTGDPDYDVENHDTAELPPGPDFGTGGRPGWGNGTGGGPGWGNGTRRGPGWRQGYGPGRGGSSGNGPGR